MEDAIIFSSPILLLIFLISFLLHAFAERTDKARYFFFVLFGGGFRVRRNLFFFKRSGISGNLYFCASLFFDDGFRSSIIRR